MANTEAENKKTYHHGDLRAELLRAAEEVLSADGIEAFSLRAVAKRAGVSHGAPAHHFGDVRGLLTALATIGYERFVETQVDRQRRAAPDAKSQLTASGLGYIDFAMQNSALFRLMFSSQKPDKAERTLEDAANAAFSKLESDIRSFRNSSDLHDSTFMKDVTSAWAMVHGLAELMIAGRSPLTAALDQMTQPDRDATLSDIILRAIGD